VQASFGELDDVFIAKRNDAVDELVPVLFAGFYILTHDGGPPKQG
jgi:hypothetical protein